MRRFWPEKFLARSRTLPALATLFVLSGCWYRLSLDQSHPSTIDLKDFQPIAVLPIPDVPDHPQIASHLSASVREFLAEEGYSLVPPSAVAKGLEEAGLSGPGLLSDHTSLRKFAERTKAKLLLVGNILEYRTQKSYVRSQTFQVWTGSVYDYETLPTYHQGTMQMRLVLKLWDPQKNQLVWMAEGHASGPSSTEVSLGKGLVRRLMVDMQPPAKPGASSLPSR